MADPLLTSLCPICHISKPQYRCPRCSVRTCSLACVKKHKAWSQCSGERDPCAYVPRSKLRTAAGVDHDYNFLHGIELAAERAEKVLVDDRGIIQAEELRPLTMQEVRWKPGRDGRRRKVLVTRVLREAKGRVIERHLAHKLAELNIEMLCAPTGMSRQKENHTTLNRRSGRVNWQVEWLLMSGVPTRILSKVMDDVPLYRAYHAVLQEQDKVQGRGSRRMTRPTSQNHADSTWHRTADSLQDASSNAAWVTGQGGAAVDEWPGEMESTQYRAFGYFLARQRTRADEPLMVTRLDPGDVLREVLADTRVVEFPTIYVLKGGEDVPVGFVLGPKDTIRPKVPAGMAKRKGEERLSTHTGRPSKRRRPGVGHFQEEGRERGNTDGEGEDEDGGLEYGEVIGEQEMGDDVEGADDDVDTTSSSGSDGEMEEV